MRKTSRSETVVPSFAITSADERVDFSHGCDSTVRFLTWSSNGEASTMDIFHSEETNEKGSHLRQKGQRA